MTEVVFGQLNILLLCPINRDFIWRESMCVFLINASPTQESFSITNQFPILIAIDFNRSL